MVGLFRRDIVAMDIVDYYPSFDKVVEIADILGFEIIIQKRVNQMLRYSKRQVRKKLGHLMLEAHVSPIVITRVGEDDVVMVRYSEFMKLLEDSEDLQDIRAIDEALSDPEPSIPWEQVKKELGFG